MRITIVGLIFVLLFSSCQNNVDQKGEVIASVYGKNLYKTDLDNISFKGITYNDSVVRARAFIDKWIKNQLLLRQAENNLDPKQLDFSKRLEEYRNSLVINKYETELIMQNLNTEVTDEQILEYYNSNTGEFRLNRNVVRLAVVSLPKESNKKWIFTKLMRDYDSLMTDSISSMADEYAESYDMNIDQWYNFEEIIDKYNLEVDNQEIFLKNNRFLVVNNDDLSTLIRFCEYRLIGDDSPCELQTDRIKYIILSSRKKELLEKLYDDLYAKAIQDKAFEIY